MHPYLFWYITVSLAFTSLMFVWMAVRDIYAMFFNPKSIDPKFGYNFESQLSWIVLVATLPFLNAVAIIYILFNWLAITYDEFRDYLGRK